MTNRRIALLASLAVLVLSVGISPSLAAKRGKPSPSPCSAPTLTGPSSASVGSTYTVNGCGFQPGQFVALTVGEADGCCMALNTTADSNGAFSYSGTVTGAGKYSVTASLPSHNRWRAVAQWTFQASG